MRHSNHIDEGSSTWFCAVLLQLGVNAGLVGEENHLLEQVTTPMAPHLPHLLRGERPGNVTT